MPAKWVPAAEAIAFIQSGMRVFMHGGAATPVHLIRELLNQKDRLSKVELVSISQLGIDLNGADLAAHFYLNSLFVSNSNRKAVNAANGDYIPVFLSEIHKLLNGGLLRPDVGLFQVSSPDRHGYCSLGTSVDVARDAFLAAKIKIAQVNPKMPRVHGDSFVPLDGFDFLVQVNEDLPEVSYSGECTDAHAAIGKIVAGLIEDGSTLQLGIGSIPDSVLSALHQHKNLGLHTEMFSDGVIPLIQAGIINNACKKKHRGFCVTSFLTGTRKLYDFVDDNPNIKALPASYVNDPRIISANPQVVAINSAIEVDITGQVCADSIGTFQYSGIGGQVDFIRGAALSDGGMPIIALPSVTRNGESRLVDTLKPGAGVVTSRGHIHWVVTEFGAVNLFGLNMEQRAKALISIAHPNHRENLEKSFQERFC